MPKVISCEEFRTAVDSAIRQMDIELMAIVAEEGAEGPEFSFEDWWDHLAQISVPDLLVGPPVDPQARRVA